MILTGCLCCLPGQEPARPAQERVVKVVFTMDDRPEDNRSDTLFYHQRASIAADYRGQPPNAHGRNEAVSFSSFAFDGGSRSYRDTLEIHLVLQVFWVKRSSWARTMPPNQHTLEHEQLHFDITRLVAERFRRKVMEMPLTIDDHESRIQYEYLEYFRMMHDLQDEFDDATRGGMDPAAQQQWLHKIRNELIAYGVQPPVQ